MARLEVYPGGRIRETRGHQSYVRTKIVEWAVEIRQDNNWRTRRANAMFSLSSGVPTFELALDYLERVTDQTGGSFGLMNWY
jgi:hypothetical protein